MGGLKIWEILLILLVIMLLFGSTRLPQLGSSLGSAIRNFKRGFGGEDEETEKKLTGPTEVASQSTKNKDTDKA